MSSIPYKRVLFKVSGESMMGDKPFGHDIQAIKKIATQIIEVYNQGTEVCLVVGGGNIFRGVSVAAGDMDRVSADYMGMLATNINALALQSAIERQGVNTRMQSAIEMNTICETYSRRRAIRHLEKGRIVIFASGTGNPYFTTDTASTLRAIETDCNVILKGTQVDGVYSADPKKDPNAIRYDRLTYDEVIAQDLKVMDATAFTLARDNHIPILVFPIQEEGALLRALKGEGKFTIVEN